jgi:hypothetical protein
MPDLTLENLLLAAAKINLSLTDSALRLAAQDATSFEVKVIRSFGVE